MENKCYAKTCRELKQNLASENAELKAKNDELEKKLSDSEKKNEAVTNENTLLLAKAASLETKLSGEENKHDQWTICQLAVNKNLRDTIEQLEEEKMRWQGGEPKRKRSRLAKTTLSRHYDEFRYGDLI